MNVTANREVFLSRLGQFRPKNHARERAIAMYSCAVALADETAMASSIEIGARHEITREVFYEIVLQSYLFLGFPRMLTAAEILDRYIPLRHDGASIEAISADESRRWFEDGLALCRRVYADKYDILMDRVAAMAPEVFRWMIVEGYGKVLSRPELDVVSREVSIISFLMMENRVKQLQSHIIGAFNVGAPVDLVRSVIDDIGPAAGEGYTSCRNILNRLGVE